MIEMAPTKKIRINRKPERGYYDRETLYKILDEALICHVGFVEDGQPFVIPINFARVEDEIILHGAKASRLLKHVEAGHPICIEATLVDGLVLARSVFHSSVNYRSAVVFGKGRPITELQEKLAALEAVVNHLIPGRWKDARLPTQKELDSTRVVAVKIDEASAKIRVGPPGDEAEDYALPVWAGVLPLREIPLEPVRDEVLPKEIEAPDYITNYSRALH